MLIQTNGDSISYRIISHNSRTPIVAQATTSKKLPSCRIISHNSRTPIVAQATTAKKIYRVTP